jgi:hypothetical protein
MTQNRILILLAGLVFLLRPSGASLQYYTTASSFATEAQTVDSLTVSSSLIAFSSSNLMTIGGVTNDEYLDPATGIEFLAFNASLAPQPFTVSGGVLDTQTGNGDLIEIIIPSTIYGIGVNLTTNFNDNLCLDASASGCAWNTYLTSGQSAFAGVLNDNPLPAGSLPALWTHPFGGSPATDVQSFEVATMNGGSETPEGSTMLLLGSGLLAIGLKHRKLSAA